MEVLVIYDYKTVTNIDFNFKRLFGTNIKAADAEAARIMRNKILRKTAIIFLGAVLWYLSTPTSIFAYAAGTGGIEHLCLKFWSYVKIIARWACLIKCGLDISKNITSDAKGIATIVFRYIIAYAAIILLPWIFDEIDRAVQ